MATPKRRLTKSRRNQRRSQIMLEQKAFQKCPKCGKATLPHRACANCGSYKGRQVIDVLKKLNKIERKAKEKELKKNEVKEPEAK